MHLREKIYLKAEPDELVILCDDMASTCQSQQTPINWKIHRGELKLLLKIKWHTTLLSCVSTVEDLEVQFYNSHLIKIADCLGEYKSQSMENLSIVKRP